MVTSLGKGVPNHPDVIGITRPSILLFVVTVEKRNTAKPPVD